MVNIDVEVSTENGVVQKGSICVSPKYWSKIAKVCQEQGCDLSNAVLDGLVMYVCLHEHDKKRFVRERFGKWLAPKGLAPKGNQ